MTAPFLTGPLLADKKGNLYGMTDLGGANSCFGGSFCGAVFELSPPTGKQTQWTEKVLWSFGATRDDGEFPFGSLITDNRGNLYSTTLFGGAYCFQCGTVFELSPPTGKQTQWTEKVLWSFQGSPGDGRAPGGALIADNQGNFYGTTVNGGANSFFYGTVFELSPPTGKETQWTEKVLWSFGARDDGFNPEASLIADKRGNLYSTTSFGGANGGGTVFEVSPPTDKQTQWSERVLWNFGATSDDGKTPFAGLIAERGNFYGTTSGGGANGLGTAFELTLP
jgi:uncharacterized repeat protein (TIGR03803 family)